MGMIVEHTFDENTYRHTLNGHQVVLHCHHYLSLMTKLAESFADVGGIRVLREVAEDSILPMLTDYFEQHGIASSEERFAIANEYYRVMGMGKIAIGGSESGGEAVLSASHVDEGWTKKFGPSESAINHVTCGFVAAAFAAAFDRPARSFKASEVESIACGAPAGRFTVTVES